MHIYDFTTDYLPYCLDRQEDGSYIPLNRDMKPVAFRPDQFGLVGDAAGFVRFEGITPKLAASLSCFNDTNTKRIYMYDDERVPTSNSEYLSDYLYRLGLLSSLQTEEEAS